MHTGIDVELVVPSSGCPVAGASEETETAITDVSRTSVVGAGEVAESFAVEGELDDSTSFDEWTVGESRTEYRFSRSDDAGCVCEHVEETAGPVQDIRAADGALHVSFRVADAGQVRDIVAELKDEFGDVHVRQLRRASEEGDADPIPVDRADLTDRQLEVLRTAHEMGYFDYPKGANAETVAERLDISPSTFAEHLAAAEQKIIDAVVD